MKTETNFDATATTIRKGVNLVEASAGTGKTYAIGMLMLRAVTELRLPIDSILVVTFTKAATEELRSRIRARLAEARDMLGGVDRPYDSTMQQWEATVQDRQPARDRLQLALYDIDRAGIFTIHSFCQRMLQEQALESGELFDVELSANIEVIRRQVVEDYWRTTMYDLPPVPCSIMISSFPTPDSLYDSIREIVPAAGRIEPVAGPVEDAVRRLAAGIAGLQEWWKDGAPALYHYFSATRDAAKFKQFLQENLNEWWRQLTSFCAGELLRLPQNLKLLSRAGLLEELHGNKIRGKDKQLQFIADWPLPDRQVSECIQAGQDLVLAIRVNLAVTLRDELPRRMYRQGMMSFDDLIHRLSGALRDGRGTYLQAVLAARFQMALIDEFQDTDSAQWHIFSTLFGGGGHYLYLIGDPKQAIYKFRGADIYSYFEARQQADQHLTLGSNYRSMPLLVEEVNRLFGSRPQPFAFPEEMMRYSAVAPARTMEDGYLERDGRPLAAMIYNRLPSTNAEGGAWTVEEIEDCLRKAILHEISSLLDPERPVFFVGKDRNGPIHRPLQPEDIAILVRSNKQAEAYLEILADAGIPAVVASKVSVFRTEECRELYMLLTALAAPGDTGRLKTALTISWFAMTGNDLQRLWRDETRLDEWIGRFQAYHQLWLAYGCLTMMNRLMTDEQVYLIMAGQKRAERRIANIHHLLELVQEAETGESFGCGQTLQWLRTMMTEGKGLENMELRLESDKAAVRIVTMHGSKGLEYPVVFCPSLWQRSGRLRKEKQQISCHDSENRLVIDLGSPEFGERKEQALAEELAEDLRLLYVAITRAVLRCSVYWVDTSAGKGGGSFSSALGYLLFPAGPVDRNGQDAVFAQLARNPAVECYEILEEDLETQPFRHEARQEVVLAPLSQSGRTLHTDWQLTSYSALASLSEHDDGEAAENGRSDISAEDRIACPGLPAGANFGNVIHDFLEAHSFADIAAGEDLTATLRQLTNRYGVTADPGHLGNLLINIVNTPLMTAGNGATSGGNFCLADLSEANLVKEMPFTFHLTAMHTEEINALLAREETVAPLSHRSMRGYLTGFVDLFCEYGGRYYILDYKTNFLGEHQADYGPENLLRSMASHNYGLQYWIYSLIVHRFLRNLRPDYRYEDHFGGVFYLFVRGMMPARAGSGVFAARPDKVILDRLDACLGGCL
jgi:exodeoxyribonuclease V beta subunit